MNVKHIGMFASGPLTSQVKGSEFSMSVFVRNEVML